MSEPRDRTPASNRDLTETVAHKAERKLKARGERQRGVWFGLGMFGLVGWAVAIPAVIAYNHYAAKLGLFTGELEGFASEFIGTLAREGRV